MSDEDTEDTTDEATDEGTTGEALEESTVTPGESDITATKAPDENPQESGPEAEAQPAEAVDDSPFGPYTKKQYGHLHARLTEYDRTGQPELAQRLQMKMNDGVPFEDIFAKAEQPVGPVVRPETSVSASEVEVPPRDGPKATAGAWREFAAVVSTMEPDVLTELGREDIINLLEERKIIDLLDLPE